jgi:hypothetical protein
MRADIFILVFVNSIIKSCFVASYFTYIFVVFNKHKKNMVY